MSQDRTERKHWRERLLDAVTVLVAVAALLVVGERYLLPMVSGGGRDGAPAAARVEKELAGHAPGAVELVAREGGARQPVTFAGASPRLVVLFRSDCPACRVTKPIWERLAAELPGSERLHAITAEPAGMDGAFFGSDRVDVWHAAEPTQYRKAYPSPYVPTTLVLAPDGRIRYARVGVLRESDVDSLKALLRGTGTQ